jgi:hypothetical protein
MGETSRGRWKRRVGVFRFEPRSAWVGGERVLDGGEDAPMERRDLLFIVAVLGGIFLLAGIVAVLAALVGWV